MKTIINGIFKDNPVAVLLLGLCSALAVTTKLENAFLMGLSVTVVLMFSEMTISIIKNQVPDNVRIPTYIIIIGTFVTILELLLATYVKPLYQALGIYLPLIVVNCIVLGRCIEIASKNSIKTSFLDSIGVGLGYTVVLIIISVIREIIGSGTITIIDSLSSITNFKLIINILPTNMTVKIFSEPAGAFLTLGALIGVINYIKEKRRSHESN